MFYVLTWQSKGLIIDLESANTGTHNHTHAPVDDFMLTVRNGMAS
jgi:hypothetical protein